MDKRQIIAALCILLTLALLLVAALTSGTAPDSPLSPFDAPVLDQFTYFAVVMRDGAPDPVLRNPSFEGGEGGTCEYYDAYVGHILSDCQNEQIVPRYWVFGWYEHYAEGLCYSGLTGRPEANLSDRRHPQDVYDGEYSAHAFTYWRCGRFWWQQIVATVPGLRYTFGAAVRTWPGNTRMFARVCIDAVCTAWNNTNGAWVQLQRTARVATISTVVWVECRAEWPDGVNNDCWADAAWVRIER